jgi:hypothetical protein
MANMVGRPRQIPILQSIIYGAVLLGDLCLEDSMLSDAGLTIPAGCYDLLLSVITDIAPQDNLPASQARIQFMTQETGEIVADFEARQTELVPDAPPFSGIRIETTAVTEQRSMFDPTRPEALRGIFDPVLSQSVDVPELTCVEKCNKQSCDKCAAKGENVKWDQYWKICTTMGESASECKVDPFKMCYDVENCDGTKTMVNIGVTLWGLIPPSPSRVIRFLWKFF